MISYGWKRLRFFLGRRSHWLWVDDDERMVWIERPMMKEVSESSRAKEAAKDGMPPESEAKIV